jgi:hypothetical protein
MRKVFSRLDEGGYAVRIYPPMPYDAFGLIWFWIIYFD